MITGWTITLICDKCEHDFPFKMRHEMFRELFTYDGGCPRCGNPWQVEYMEQLGSKPEDDESVYGVLLFSGVRRGLSVMTSVAEDLK